MRPTDQVIVNSVITWFENAVIGLDLCPFALRPYRNGAVRFELSHASDDASCLGDLYLALARLDQDQSIETLVLICPDFLTQFSDYNQFLTLAELLLEQEGWQGIYQIASFHPDYRFSGTRADDRSNWTNRSPFPLLHLIREASVSRAVASDIAVAEIPTVNCKRLEGMDEAQMIEVFGRRYRG